MNKLILIGRLANDPKLEFTKNGTAVAVFTLAVDRENTAKEADFIRCKAFNKTAELIAEHLQKGRQIGVDGRLQISQWETPAREKKSLAECIVNRIDFLSHKKNDNQGQNIAQVVADIGANLGAEVIDPWTKPPF